MNQEKIRDLEQIISSDYGNVAGIVVRKNGVKQYEGYFHGYTADDAVHVFSVTKSVFSILIGIAIDKGYIQSTEQKVLDFFPDYTVKRGEKTLQNVRIRDMLTMTVPYKFKSAPYTKYFTSESWVKTALDLMGGKGKIGDFRYAPLVGPDVLSGILSNVTGQSALALQRSIYSLRWRSRRCTRSYFRARKSKLPGQPKIHILPLGRRSAGDQYGGMGAYPDSFGYGENWAALPERRAMGRQTNRFVRVGYREYKGTQPVRPMGKSWLWLSLVGTQRKHLRGYGRRRQRHLCRYRKEHGGFDRFLFKPNAKDRIALIKERIEPIFEDR
jgi:hypothetical protein